MTAPERRNAILSALVTAGSPLTASSLASMFDVSRQIIVGDISILRAGGHYIEATSRGYIMGDDRATFPFVGTIVCKHDASGVATELNAIVDCGATCIDVTIDHAVYGELTGKLDISTKFDVRLFAERMSGEDRPLSTLSGGLHMHRIGCQNAETFGKVCESLRNLGLLVEG